MRHAWSDAKLNILGGILLAAGLGGPGGWSADTAPVTPAAPPVWRADFTSAPSLEEAGWQVVGGAGIATWAQRQDGLAMSFGNKPYQGGRLQHVIPFVADADLFLEATVGMGSGYDHFSLNFAFQGMLLAFKHAYHEHQFLRYWNEQWAVISSEVPLAKRTRIRVQFTPAEHGLVQYFVDDLESPVFVEDGIYLKPPAEGPNQLQVINYGLSSGVVQHTLHAFEIRPGRSAADAASAPGATRLLAKAQLFQGIACDRYAAKDLAHALGATDTTAYTITNTSPALGEVNEFRIDRLPPFPGDAVPGHMIMADFPLNACNIHPLIIGNLVKTVQRGSHLVVLGGLCTLNKGEFAGTALAGIMPVEVADPWAVARIPAAEIFPGAWLEYLHQLPLKAGATVLAAIGDRPLWVTWPCGQGRVTVFLGLPCGQAVPGMFWKQAGWVPYAAAMIRSGGAREP